MIELKEFRFTPWHARPPVARSIRARWIASTFRLNPSTGPVSHDSRSLDAGAMALASLVPAPGKIVLIAGASGAGKSSLLRAIRRAGGRAVRWVELDRVPPRPARAVVDQFGRTPLTRVLETLSRVGLAEVWTYLRRPHELSDGQRWRLKLAMALMRSGTPRRDARPVIVCDEFAALLDRVTAAIVARALRRAVQGQRAAIVATSHEDLIRALNPDVLVRCDFGRVTIQRRRAT